LPCIILTLHNNLVMHVCEDLLIFFLLVNSLQAKLKTKNALRIYTCGSGGWTSINASGDLLDFNTSKLVGSFTAVHFPISETNITLLNSAADVAESGFLTSSVIGNEGIFSFPIQMQVVSCNIFSNNINVE
jgi:hypothetical protein